jgi:hypothetical protein
MHALRLLRWNSRGEGGVAGGVVCGTSEHQYRSSSPRGVAYLLIGLLAYGGRLFNALVGGFLLIFGIYLLWIDFIAPAVKPRDRQG